MYTIVKTHVQNLPVAGCFIFIQRKKLHAYPITLRGTQEGIAQFIIVIAADKIQLC